MNENVIYLLQTMARNPENFLRELQNTKTKINDKIDCGESLELDNHQLEADIQWAKVDLQSWESALKNDHEAAARLRAEVALKVLECQALRIETDRCQMRVAALQGQLTVLMESSESWGADLDRKRAEFGDLHGSRSYLRVKKMRDDGRRQSTTLKEETRNQEERGQRLQCAIQERFELREKIEKAEALHQLLRNEVSATQALWNESRKAVEALEVEAAAVSADLEAEVLEVDVARAEGDVVMGNASDDKEVDRTSPEVKKKKWSFTAASSLMK